MKKTPVNIKKNEASLNSFIRKREQMAKWFATANTVPKSSIEMNAFAQLRASKHVLHIPD